MTRRIGVVTGVVLLIAGICAAPASARGLSLGVMDFAPFEGADNAAWFDRAGRVSAGLVRLTGRWVEIAPAARSRLRDPRDPADPGYRWERLDTAVRGAHDRGLGVLLTIHRAPAWAEGSGRARTARPGTWRPDPAAFADFVTAAARRYSGTFPDPLRPGATLPRVRYWQPWNEPNLPTYLTPQWTRRSGKNTPASPVWYRRLLNAAYTRLKRVDPGNRVIAAGTAPYGDPATVGNRMTPVLFLRELLCLHGPALRRTRCGARPKLDGIDHHPYATGSPTQPAILPENVAIPDLGKLTRVLRAARRAGTVRPKGGKSVWITELSWDSNPPDPDGVPEARRAEWAQDALHSLWRQGATAIFWFLLRDQPPVPAYNATYQSGLYTLDGQPKATAAAFRFPLVARATSRTARTRIWGRSPTAGTVTIERQRAGVWQTIATLTTRGSVFQGFATAAKGDTLRARVGAETSLPRTVK